MPLEIISRAAEFFAGQGIPAYLVGGYVRDLLLGRVTNDVDIAVAGDPLALGRTLAQNLGGTFVPLDEVNPTARVALTDALYLDLTQLRGDSIHADLAQRDFTINAMAITMASCLSDAPASQLTDPFHGQDDLRAGRIRAVADTSFRSDPLRLLRAVRFHAELGFAIVPATAALIRRDAALIVHPAAERVREELARIVAAPDAADALRLLDRLGLLAPLMPEVAALKGVTQPPEHYWDVYEHSLQAVAEVERVANSTICNLPSAISGYLAEILPGGHSRLTMLKFAALLHDVAKPQCKTIEPSGRIRFFGHQDQGAVQAATLMQRWRFSAKEIATVETIILNHMRPAQLAEGDLTGRAIYRYFRDTGEEGIGALLLSLADHRATSGPHLAPAAWQHHLDFTRRMLDAYYQEPQRAVAPPRLLTGDDVMAALSIPPGKLVGQILEQIREAQAAGEVTTREEALSLAKRLLL